MEKRDMKIAGGDQTMKDRVLDIGGCKSRIPEEGVY